MRSVKKHPIMGVFKKYRMLKYLEDGRADLITPEIAEFMNRLETAVNALTPKEKAIIENRYLTSDAEYIFDYQVYEEMNLLPAVYKAFRNNAIDKLSLALGLEK